MYDSGIRYNFLNRKSRTQNWLKCIEFPLESSDLGKTRRVAYDMYISFRTFDYRRNVQCWKILDKKDARKMLSKRKKGTA